MDLRPHATAVMTLAYLFMSAKPRKKLAALNDLHRALDPITAAMVTRYGHHCPPGAEAVRTYARAVNRLEAFVGLGDTSYKDAAELANATVALVESL